MTCGRDPNTVILPSFAGQGETHGWAPLFYPSRISTGWRAFTQILIKPAELMFIAIEGPPLTGNPRSAACLQAWWPELLARHRAHADKLNNHQRFFTVHRPEDEIEHKFTLPRETNILTLATRLLSAFVGNEFPGWICDYHNEFEQWDFLNHLFEITSPESARGYISFIPATDQTWIIKRKWFAQDQQIRREHRDRGIVLPPEADLADEIRTRFDLDPAWGASFRRVRYDINIESLRTGHGYSVMVDRVTTLDRPVAILKQCEIEYLRSRTLSPIQDEVLLHEFDSLCHLIRVWLSHQDVPVTEDHLSKLTFLRQQTQAGHISGATTC